MSRTEVSVRGANRGRNRRSQRRQSSNSGTKIPASGTITWVGTKRKIDLLSSAGVASARQYAGQISSRVCQFTSKLSLKVSSGQLDDRF